MKKIRKGRIKDLLGQTFGRLTVISFEYTKDSKAYWLCRCRCGKSKVIGTCSLTSGTKSCGCLQKEIAGNTFQDLTGQKFGRLTVLTREPYKNRNITTKWFCICECGTKTKAIRLTDLKNGKVKSCGCFNKEQMKLRNIGKLTGIKNGMVTIGESVRFNSIHKQVYLCKCDCGKSFEVAGSSIVSGNTTSCGCQVPIAKRKSSYFGGKYISATRFGHFRQGAKVRGLVFRISIEDIDKMYENQSGLCFWTGVLIQDAVAINEASSESNLSIDRKINSVGYTVKNCHLCTKKSNVIRQKLSIKEYEFFSKSIYDYQNGLFVPKARRINTSIAHPANHTGKHTVSGSYIASLKGGAKSRGFDFNISACDVWSVYTKQGFVCALSGLDIDFCSNFEKAKTDKTAQTASVDRIDSKLGYSLDNIQIVHKSINIMKWDYSNQELIDNCSRITTYRNLV